MCWVLVRSGTGKYIALVISGVCTVGVHLLEEKRVPVYAAL